MPEFFNIVTPAEALNILAKNIQPHGAIEVVDVREAGSRALAAAIYAETNLPTFPRSTMDGYAIRAMDAFGATEGLPAYFRVIGEMPMGRSSPISPQMGEAVKIHTGGMLPTGADAVVMVENTQQVDAATIEVVKPVAPGENALRIGDDIHSGQLLFPAGHWLRPQDIGGLAALGITRLKVFRPTRVAIISTGDEIIPPENEPSPGQVRDINSYTIAALTQQYGGTALPLGIIADNLNQLKQAALAGIAQADILVISAGSSVSTRDMTVEAIASLGQPGILVHGVALRPGKPTIIAMAGSKPVFGLPGNPVSTAVTFDLFVRPAIYRVGGCGQPPEKPTATARLTRNIPSTTGREDYVPVKLEWQNGQLTASPIFGESNLITTLIRADGMAVVPLDVHGLSEGELVQVRRF
jgi:molybdopterin molybdotransferase